MSDNSQITSAAPRLGAKRGAGLSGTALKYIALALMLLDHIHYMFSFTGQVPVLFSMLGRLSAPIFLFCTAEGFAHTHDRRRYYLRIYVISALMGGLEFFGNYAGFLNRGDGFYPQNAIFMVFAVLIPVWQGIDWLRGGRALRGVLVIAAVAAWPFAAALLSQQGVATSVGLIAYTLLPCWSIITDGGMFFILGGVLMYALRGSKWQLPGWAAYTFLADFVRIWLLAGVGGNLTLMFTDYYEWFSVFAVALLALYNGRRGSGHKALFYLFYPAHIYILFALSCLVYAFAR